MLDCKEFVSFEEYMTTNVFKLIFKDSYGRRNTMFLTNVIPDEVAQEVDDALAEKYKDTRL
jgi:hypothetical protein